MNARKYNRGTRRPRTHRHVGQPRHVSRTSGCLLILAADLAAFGGVMWLIAQALT